MDKIADKKSLKSNVVDSVFLSAFWKLFLGFSGGNFLKIRQIIPLLVFFREYFSSSIDKIIMGTTKTSTAMA